MLTASLVDATGASRHLANDPEPAATACFSIEAEANPSVMPRVLELFAKRGLIPSRWHSDLSGPDMLWIDLQVDGLTRQQVSHVAECIRGMVGVGSVLTSEKLYA
jgi:acetolactate synthase small subunit